MITLSSILYEKNYKNFFNEENFFWKFNSKYITSKILIINNINSVEVFNAKINEWKEKFDFDIFFVSEYEDEVLKYFNLNIDKNQTGYLYTIPYYVMGNVCDTEYLLNIATDCVKNITLNDDFFEKSFNEFDTNENCFVISIPWVKDNSRVVNGLTCGEHEMVSYNLTEYKTSYFLPTKGFSDQFFLIPIKNIKTCNFNTEDSGIYGGPGYCGGICFEKKIIDFMSTTNKYRYIFDGSLYYLHEND